MFRRAMFVGLGLVGFIVIAAGMPNEPLACGLVARLRYKA
jgi:hypothetical protein